MTTVHIVTFSVIRWNDLGYAKRGETLQREETTLKGLTNKGAKRVATRWAGQTELDKADWTKVSHGHEKSATDHEGLELKLTLRGPYYRA